METSKLLLVISCLPVILTVHSFKIGERQGTSQKCVADVAFVLDSSRSIWIKDFEDNMKKFLLDFVSLFTLGPNDVQFSSLTFGDSVAINYEFGSYDHSLTKLQKEIVEETQHMYGKNTQTYAGLKTACNDLFSPDKGARDGDVPHVIILLSDGGTNPGWSGISREDALRQTLIEAQNCKDNAVVILTVGVGRAVNETELRLVASDPTSYTHVSDFKALENTKARLSDLVCTAVKPTLPPDDNEQKDEETKNKCKGLPAEVIFVLDASTSIGNQSRFDVELSFVSRVVNYFDISPNATRVGVMVFSNEPEELIDFQNGDDKASLQTLIKDIKWTKGDTFTDLALERLADMYNPEYGGREGVKKIGIVVTDGSSTDPWRTKEMAKKVHDKGITMFAIGVGLKSNEELETIASSPSENFVFKVNDLSSLEKIKRELADHTCDSDQDDEPDKLCQAARAEFIFLLDASTSIGEHAFRQQLDFVAKFTDTLTLGADGARVAVATFSDESRVEFNLDQFDEKQEMQLMIKSINYTTGLTYTNKGLETVSTEILPLARDVPKVLILITDGKSRLPTETVSEAENLRDQDVKIITVGVGPYVDKDELDDVVDDDSLVLMIEDYDKFETIVKEFKQKVCEGASSSPSKKFYEKDDQIRSKIARLLSFLKKDNNF